MDTLITPRLRQAAKRRKVIIWTVAAGALMLAAAVFFHELDVNPSVSIPTPILPSPNAFGDYGRAGALMKDEREINVPGGRGTPRTELLPPDAQQRVLLDNAPALAALRQGVAHVYANPPARSVSALFPYLEPDRALARLLALQADVQASRGEWGASAQTSLDGLKMGADIPRGGGVIHLLTGIAMAAISREALGRAVDHLSLSETNAALGRFRAIDAGPQSAAQTLQEEKWTTQGSLMEMFRSPIWRAGLLSGGRDGSGPSLSTRMSYFLTSKRRVMDDYTWYMDSAISSVGAHRPMPPIDPAHSDPFTNTLTPVFTGLPTRCDDDRTQNGFLEIALALHAYELQHHEYPETLAPLSPGLLPRTPEDPFAPGRPLKYQKTGTTYLLYSIGPDGVDDSGKAIDDPSKTDVKRRHSVLNGSKGDIVAGVNF